MAGARWAPLYLLTAVILEFAATPGAAVLAFQQLGGETGVSFVLPLVPVRCRAGDRLQPPHDARLREEMLAGKPVHTAMAEVIRSVAPAVAAAGLVLASSLGTLILESGQAARQQGFAMAFGIPPASPGRLVDPGSSAHRPGFATSVAAPRFHTRAHRDGTTQAARASAFRVGPRQ